MNIMRKFSVTAHPIKLGGYLFSGALRVRTVTDCVSSQLSCFQGWPSPFNSKDGWGHFITCVSESTL